MSGDQRDINPYASPSFASTPSVEVITRDEALRRLRKPAICLAVSSFGSILWGIGALVFGFEPGPADVKEYPLLLIPILIVLVLLPAIILASAINVVRGHCRPWLWVAIVSGVVPLGTGCVCFSVVFALWLLHFAMQRPIRDALRSPSISASGTS